MDFRKKLLAVWDKNNSLLCVGLDPDMTKLPASLSASQSPVVDFNKAIIDATADLVCAFKPNSAFYEARGATGIEELKQTCDYIKEKYPDMPIILDFKRGDIGNTNEHYAKLAFDYLGVDAITVQPYLGRDAVQAFLDYKDKGIIVLCRTTNEGSDEFQSLDVAGRELYLKVAEDVATEWNANGNCLLVMGAQYPQEMAQVREIVGEAMVFLVPGIGAQGGDTEASVQAGINQAGSGLIISSSRDILYASNGEDFADAARQKALNMRDEINKYRGV